MWPLSCRTSIVSWFGAALVSLLLFSPASFCAEPDGAIKISLERAYDVFPGTYLTVHVNIENPDAMMEFDEFRLLIEYPPEAVSISSASRGELLENCGWESFSYSIFGGRYILLTVSADLPDIPGEPTCYLGGSSGILANLKFYVQNDPANECLFFPIQFYWMECQDNHLSVRGGNEFLVSDNVTVLDWVSDEVSVPREDTLPTYGGTPDMCLDNFPAGAEVFRTVDFKGGAFDIICSDSIDFRGDLNLNNVPNEIADYVVYENYLLYGLSAFDINVQGQVAASDINNDGLVLTYRDFVYLWRVLIGDALPYPKSSPEVGYPVTFVQHDVDSVSIVLSEVPLAGAYLVFDGNIVPSLIPPVFEMSYNNDAESNETRVVIKPVNRETTLSNGPLLTFEGSGTLKAAETADYEDSRFVETVLVTQAEISVTYVVDLLQYIFADGALPSPSQYADADCSGAVDIDDVVYLIAYIFAGGPAPGGC